MYDVLASWRYSGEALMKEKIAIDIFIDRKLERYDDLVRLHDEYGKLLRLYPRVLADDPHCRLAVKGVLRNVKVLKVAIGEIREQLFAMCDYMKGPKKDPPKNDPQKNYLQKNYLQKNSQAKSGWPEIAEKPYGTAVVEFADCRAFTCKNVLTHHNRFWTQLENNVGRLQTYQKGNETILISADKLKMIKQWNLSKNSLVASLTVRNSLIAALVIFVRNGVHMLASGNRNEKINIWVLSSNTHVKTLDTGHLLFTASLTVYLKNSKNFLITSGLVDNLIKVWDADTYKVIKKLTMCVY